MAAFATTCLSARRWAACALLTALLLGCAAPKAPQSILAERCLAVSAALPLTVAVSSPGAGTLRVAIRQRGISVAAALIEGAASTDTVSPADRYGAMTLVADVREAHQFTIRIISRDSPDIVGEACVSAELVDAADTARIAAEHAFAAAGRATAARHWQAAFDDYLTAARAFDRLDRHRAGDAHQAMALLAYRQLDRSRDGYALAQRALADFGPDADRGLASTLAELQATIILESKGMQPAPRRERVLQLLKNSALFARQARFGTREVPRLLILRGFLEYATGNFLIAAGIFSQAAAQCEDLRDWECYARARMDGAVIAEETGHSTTALQGYADALRILSPTVAPGLAADIWDNLGRLQGYIGLTTLGEQSQLNAISIYARIDNCDGVRRALSTLGSILVHVGNVDVGFVYLDLAASYACPPLLAATSGPAGENIRKLGEIPDSKFDMRAIDHAPAHAACSNPPAPAALSEDGEMSVFRALLSTSDGAMLEGNRDIALRCLAAAKPYAIEPRRELRLANAMGSSLIESGDAARARAAFVHTLNAADQAGLTAKNESRATAYLGLARAALLTHEDSLALRDSTHALMLGSARADFGQVVSALQILTMGLLATGDRGHAQQTLRTAVNLIEQVPIDDLDAETRAAFLATQHRVFEELTDILVEDAQASTNTAAARAQAWAAFGVSERGRARSLQYAISQATDNDALHVHAGSTAEYQGLLAQIAAVAASADTSAGWSGALAQLENLSAQGHEAPEAVSPEKLLPQLDRLKATLVEFATGRNDMFAFVVDGGEIHIVPLGDRKRINAAALDLYERLHDSESADEDVRRASSRLAQFALWPLTKYVSGTRVIFVADDSLHTIPFAVLPWSQDAKSTLVLQHVETVILPSTLFMLHRANVRNADGLVPRFELIGDPIFQAADWRHDCADAGAAEPIAAQPRAARDWSESLPRLPGSRAEVLAIAKLARAAAPAGRINIHLGCTATPSALRQAAGGAPALLHIATHGYVDARRPRLSALALTRESATRPESGLFGLLDILNIKTAAGLVVLSACDTSRGRLLPGEGVLGPAQAFLQSGAASVVASFWRIDDAATASFMRTFYQYLLTERLPVATALRRAQLDAAAAGSARNWAGFALFGSPDAVF